MADLKWRPQALKDLDAIEAYFLDASPSYAPIFVAGVFERVRALAEMPQMGPMFPYVGDPAIRHLVYNGYHIIYFYDEHNDSVEVLAMGHTAKDWGDASGR